jgi:hypothetical protein
MLRSFTTNILVRDSAAAAVTHPRSCFLQWRTPYRTEASSKQGNKEKGTQFLAQVGFDRESGIKSPTQHDTMATHLHVPCTCTFHAPACSLHLHIPCTCMFPAPAHSLHLHAVPACLLCLVVLHAVPACMPVTPVTPQRLLCKIYGSR